MIAADVNAEAAVAAAREAVEDWRYWVAMGYGF